MYICMYVWPPYLDSAKFKLEDIGAGGLGKDCREKLGARLHLWRGECLVIRVRLKLHVATFFFNVIHQVKNYFKCIILEKEGFFFSRNVLLGSKSLSWQGNICNKLNIKKVLISANASKLQLCYCFMKIQL